MAGPDTRLIFVDDGSNDGGGPLLDELAAAARFPALVLHQANGGVSRARNAGLAASTADWVTFFDVDDAMAPDYLSWLRKQTEGSGFELLLFGSRRVREGENLPESPESAPPREVSPEEELKAFLRDPTRLGVYNLLLRRSLLERAGLRFAEGWPYYEDYDFLVRAIAQARGIRVTEKVLYYYVLRPGSTMARFTPERLSCLTLLDRLGDWLVTAAPGFAPEYRRRFLPRIYWSVLWQAALAAPDLRAFRAFGKKTRAALNLRGLRGFPDPLVRLSSAVYRLSAPAYYLAVRLLGRKKSKVTPLTADELDAAADACPDLRRVLVYGMSNNPGGVESYLLGAYGRNPQWKWDFLCDFPDLVGREALEARGSLIHFIPSKRGSLRGHLTGTVKVLRDSPLTTAVYFNVLDAGCVFPAMVARLCGRRVVVHSHNGDTDKPRLHRLLKPLLNALPLKAAACSHLAAEHMFTKKRAKSALLIPNAIDAGAFRFEEKQREETRKAMGLDGKKVLLHVGRLTYQKNPLFLLELIAALRARDPDWVLLSVGTGDLEEEFRTEIRHRGLEDAVLPLGVRRDLPELYRAADVFVLPSFYEGLPIVALEAQAAGLPCLLSDAVTPEAGITDCARFLSLSLGAGGWADAVTELATLPRKDTTEEIRRAGYDKSCCGEADRALEALLLG